MSYKNMKLLALFVLPVLVVLSFATTKVGLAQADYTLAQKPGAASSFHRIGPSLAGDVLALEATSAATGSLTITGVAVSDVLATSATVSWDTDDPSVGQVNYGTDTGNLSLFATSDVTGTAHSVGLTGLTPNTQYFFEVEATDEDGDQDLDNNGNAFYDFTTLPNGSLNISNVVVSTIGITSANVSWDTDDPSVGQVNYGTDTGNLSLFATSNVTGTAHAVGLTGLTPNTQYFFEVEATDEDGDEDLDNNGNAFYNFTTLADGSLSIFNVAVGNIGATSATVTWDTDDISDSLVRYGLDGNLLSSEVTSAITGTAHSVGLTNLTPGSKYAFEVESTDLDGNNTLDNNVGSYYSFTTVMAEQMRRAFVGTVVGEPGSTVDLVLNGTGAEQTISLPDDLEIKTPGGPRAGSFVDGAEVVILSEKAGNEWVAIWVLVKPTQPAPPLTGVITGIGPTSITITGEDGNEHLLRLTGQAKKAAEGLEVGDVVTVLRGNGGSQATRIVKADEVRDRMLEDIEKDEQGEVEEDEDVKKFKDKRAEALIRALDRLGLRQVEALNKILDRAPEGVKIRLRESKNKIEIRIEKAKEASDRARNRRGQSNSDDKDRPGNSDSSNRGNSENRGGGNNPIIIDQEKNGSRGNSGKSDRGNGRGKGNSSKDESDSKDNEGDED